MWYYSSFRILRKQIATDCSVGLFERKPEEEKKKIERSSLASIISREFLRLWKSQLFFIFFCLKPIYMPQVSHVIFIFFLYTRILSSKTKETILILFIYFCYFFSYIVYLLITTTDGQSFIKFNRL